MQLQLSGDEVEEFASLKSKLFGECKFLMIDEIVESNPDYHRYLILSKKLRIMHRFWRKLRHAPHPVYARVQLYLKRKNGRRICGYSSAYGLMLC